jgi:hypothetical protein
MHHNPPRLVAGASTRKLGQVREEAAVAVLPRVATSPWSCVMGPLSLELYAHD